ncbi:hypothetical protein [Oceanibacterium hippocampi]|uniref:hypothetical protein n=1 Tax=Oceanibacterium hippocampi TaxID=745714 RepID=UPI00111C300C|nr:hypothetical protein [Oceanibacterium hippocampi]
MTDLIGALERQANEILRLADRAEKEATKHSFEMYDDFRRKVSQFETLASLIPDRLANVELDAATLSDLEIQFDNLRIVTLHGLINASVRFFMVLSGSTLLPIGAKEMLMTELRRLEQSKEALEDPRFADRISDDIRASLAQAQTILERIIETAPSLLNLAEPLDA